MMRKLIGAAGALLLILPQIALAQEHHGGGGHPGGGGGGAPHMGGGGGPHMGGGAPHGGGEPHFGGGGGPHFGGGDAHHGGAAPGGGRLNGNDVRPGFDRHAAPAVRVDQRNVSVVRTTNVHNDFRGNPGGGRGPAANGRPWANGRGFPRPSNGGWHRGWYAGQRGGWERIRAPGYAYPRGWGYRRWGVGAILPAILFGSAYYWSDYSSYGIYPPPPGDRWVRYGPDLLLVNMPTGRVDDVIYGAFY